MLSALRETVVLKLRIKRFDITPAVYSSSKGKELLVSLDESD
jgi:hypothetical protein